MNFSPQQKKIIDTWNQGLAVIAGAGSGKTTTLIQKCKALLERNPEARICAVSFTEKSARDLYQKISKFTDIHQHRVMTIHGLCRSIIQDFPQLASCDGGETILSEVDSRALWEGSLERIWFDASPEKVEQAFQKLLNRESRAGLMKLIDRVKSLRGFGVLEHLLNSNDPDTLALGIVSEYVLQLFERLKIKEGALDFDDLEKFASIILENNIAKKYYHDRFDLILVDEFQDTNPTQAEIIRSISKTNLKNLCVVGDPKQSIYRFRDADVSLFEEFCQSMTVQIYLDWNFRSNPEIIRMINKVCEPAFEKSGMTYQPLVPKKTSKETHPVERWDIQDPIDFARAIKKELQDGRRLADMVLLLRRIRGSEKWIRALSAARIPIAIGSGGLFWEDPRVRELVCFLISWKIPENRLSCVTFLRAPWIGVPDQKLDQWLQGDSDLWENFFELDLPIAQNLKLRRGEELRPGELLLEFFEVEQISNELGIHLLGLWHRCEEMSYQGKSYFEICDFLNKALAENQRESALPPPSNLDQLQILTLHGSKGLEFPIVYLVDFEGKMRAREMPLLYWDRKKGAFLGKRKTDGDRDQKDKLELQWRDTEKKKELAESKRLFYVALTRAQERLVLSFLKPDPLKIKKSKQATSPYSGDSWKDWIEFSEHPIPKIDKENSSFGLKELKEEKTTEITHLEISRKVIPPVLQRTRHSVTEWVKAWKCEKHYALSELGIQTKDTEEAINAEDEFQIKSNQKIDFSKLGTAVHRILETWSEQSPGQLVEIENAFGLKYFCAQSLIDWVKRQGFFHDSSYKTWKELAFEIPISGSVLVGAIDRLVCDSEGNYSIYDYKITRDFRSNESLLEAYQIQMEIYAWAIGQLEPKSKNRLTTHLVIISPQATKTILVPTLEFDAIDRKIIGLSSSVDRIIQGVSAKPICGAQCRFCEFRSGCDVGQNYLSSASRLC